MVIEEEPPVPGARKEPVCGGHLGRAHQVSRGVDAGEATRVVVVVPHGHARHP
jgi:hypothetical protein